MPLIRAAGKLIYFVHVPKAAGTTVERYLEARFGPLAFLDRSFGALTGHALWSQTSPQHMPEEMRQRVLPDNFIDASFATVRHPATRLRSVYLFQREIEGRISQDTDFSSWLETIPALLEQNPHAFDGHIRPMSDIVPRTAQVFAIEEGLAPLTLWLDALTHTHNPAHKMQPKNVLHDRLAYEKRPTVRQELTSEALTQIASIYEADYTRFNYAITPPKQEAFP